MSLIYNILKFIDGEDKFKYADNVIIETGFHKGRKGKVIEVYHSWYPGDPEWYRVDFGNNESSKFHKNHLELLNGSY